MKLADLSIHAWIEENHIKNEKGDLINFRDHLFLYDIYRDQSPELTIMKAAQVGMTTAEILKNHFDAKRYKMDIIYTLPTDKDVQVFVGGKVNRIIANNPCMLADVVDKDSVEQKQVGPSMIYFRGTWTKKAAISVTADRLSHDEKDASKLDIIADYKSRIQHSKFKQVHTFSHPSLPETGVHADWLQSDQKHWIIQCPHCNRRQYLSWDMQDPRRMSIDIERGIFVCKKCRKELPDKVRRTGEWVAKHPGKKVSGYWVPLLLAPWRSAKDIIAIWKHPDTTPEFFTTKVLGMPHADGASKLLREHFMRCLTGQSYAAPKDEIVVIGVDTGLRLDYVVGNRKGLFYHADCDDYGELDALMERWPRAIAVVDQGGDLIGSRKFYARWPGRVFLLAFGGEKKGMQLMSWGEKDEYGSVSCDRNRMIQLVVSEFREQRVLVHGVEEDWYAYWLDWNNLTRIKVLDPNTNQIKGYQWVRSARDHRALATVCWRVGMSRFSTGGNILTPESQPKAKSYVVDPDGTVGFNPAELFDILEEEKEKDWRN